MNIKIPIHKRNIDTRIESIDKWAISKEDKKDLLKFLDDLSIGKVNKGFRISENRQIKYLEMLKIPLVYFNKPTSSLTLQDCERFQKDLATNKIKSNKKIPFAHSTKADINKEFKIYLKWKLGDNEKYRSLTDWWNTKTPVKTPDYLSEQEVEKLYRSCKNNSERFLIAILFDAGCRAEEFHNLRFEDIQLPTGSETFVKITLKEEYSKTSGRVISLFWKYSIEAVRDYLNDRIQQGIKSKDVVFNNTYDNTRQVLSRLGLKALNKKIYYHLFRHSSATHYASKLNRHELCYRYGWKFSSDMPDVYISRSGMENKQLDEKFKSNEIREIQSKLDKEKVDNQMFKENLAKKLSVIAEVLSKFDTSKKNKIPKELYDSLINIGN